MRCSSRYFVVVAGAISLLAAMIVAAGCGGPSAAERAKRRQVQANYLEQGVISFERKRNIAEAKSGYASCKARLGAYMRDLHAVDQTFRASVFIAHVFASKMEVAGPEELSSAQIAQLDPRCRAVDVVAENAMTIYVSTVLVKLMVCSEFGNCSSDELLTEGRAASNILKKMDTKFAAIARPKKVTIPTIAVPLEAAQVKASVYGRALVDLCRSDAPPDAVRPCADLGSVLAGGVTDKELGTLDGAVSKLNKAYHFDTA